MLREKEKKGNERLESNIKNWDESVNCIITKLSNIVCVILTELQFQFFGPYLANFLITSNVNLVRIGFFYRIRNIETSHFLA